MRRREIGKDQGLRVRMYLVMLALGGVYLFFVSFMMAMGIDIILVGVFAAIMLGVQYFASDKLDNLLIGEKYLFNEHSLNLLKNQICFRLKKYNTRLHDYIYNAISFYEKK